MVSASVHLVLALVHFKIMILNIIRSFIDIFAGGRSDVKIILFALYSLLLVSIYFIFKNRSTKTPKWKWFGISLLAMYIYGLFLYVFYALSNHLLLSDFFITGNNSEVSSSTIWHTHVAKGVMGQIIALFSKTNFTTMDNGGAYIGLIPSSVFLFGSLLFVIIILQAIVYFATSFKTFLIDKNNRQKIFIILGYIIISFSLIKRSIDGGMLNPDFIVSMIFIILFVLRSKGMPLTRYYYLISAVGITLLFIGLYLDFFSYGSSLGIASIAVIILLYNLILYASEKKLSLKFLIPITAFNY